MLNKETWIIIALAFGFLFYLTFLIRIMYLFKKQKLLGVWDLSFVALWLLPLAYTLLLNLFGRLMIAFPFLLLGWLALVLSIRLIYLYFSKKTLHLVGGLLVIPIFCLVCWLGIWLLSWLWIVC
ncbi:MAG: hypothetical protein MRECE_8c024 [Mycoplasmataceae bacterium CE_OT135]|nr:MAG: hypothetical protein MRECE_8c024 [Mycoplasmataceae bacterium CE_OT135]